MRVGAHTRRLGLWRDLAFLVTPGLLRGRDTFGSTLIASPFSFGGLVGSRYGFGLDFSADGQQVSYNQSQRMADAGQVGIDYMTMLAVANADEAFATDGGPARVASWNAASTPGRDNPVMHIGRGDASNDWWVRATGSSAYSVGAGADSFPADNSIGVGIGTYDRYGSPRVAIRSRMLDGGAIYKGTYDSTSGSLGNYRGPVHIGNAGWPYAGQDRTHAGTVFMVAIWLRLLSDGELAMLLQDPFVLTRAVPRHATVDRVKAVRTPQGWKP